MSNEPNDFTLPSNPADRKRIREAIYEMASTSQQIKDKRSYITDAKKMLKDEFGMPPKIATKMTKTVMEHNFRDVVAEAETFSETYEILFESADSVASVSDED